MTSLQQYTYILTSTQAINSDIIEIILHPQDLEQYISYQAGQYVISKINNIAFPLSIANAPTPHKNNDLVFHLRHNQSQPQSQDFLQLLNQTKSLKLEGPHGLMTIDNISTDTNKLILLAGGTGIAPFKAILEDLENKASPLLNKIHLFWGVKKTEDLYLKDWLKQIQATHPKFSYQLILSNVHAYPQWQGATGWVYEQALKILKNFDEKPTHVFASGPYDMVVNSQKAFLAAGFKSKYFISDMLP